MSPHQFLREHQALLPRLDGGTLAVAGHDPHGLERIRDVKRHAIGGAEGPGGQFLVALTICAQQDVILVAFRF